jgi:hypothetical protein
MYGGLRYSNLYCGVVKGALEMVNIRYFCARAICAPAYPFQLALPLAVLLTLLCRFSAPSCFHDVMTWLQSRLLHNQRPFMR